jgi:predicted ribosomally synthesized peptide with SipW-like signal peptide
VARHRAHRSAGGRQRRWFGRGRTRALLTLGTVFALGAVGTSAYWTDTATVGGTAITSGVMDLQLQTPASGTTWIHSELGTSTTDSTLTIAALTPGESQAFDFAVRNVGNPNLTYTATVAQGAGTWSYVNTPIQVRFYAGTTSGGPSRATNTSTYPRTGSCTGTAQGVAATTVTSTAQIVVPSRALGGGGSGSTDGQSEQLCVVVSMITTASNDNQGKTGTLQLVFKGDQATS